MSLSKALKPFFILLLRLFAECKVRYRNCITAQEELRLHTAVFRFLARQEILAAHGPFGFFLVLRRPGAETVAKPRHPWAELRKAQLLPNLFGIFHKFFPRQ